jgi:hypothetical protein
MNKSGLRPDDLSKVSPWSPPTALRVPGPKSEGVLWRFNPGVELVADLLEKDGHLFDLAAQGRSIGVVQVKTGVTLCEVDLRQRCTQRLRQRHNAGATRSQLPEQAFEVVRFLEERVQSDEFRFDYLFEHLGEFAAAHPVSKLRVRQVSQACDPNK